MLMTLDKRWVDRRCLGIEDMKLRMVNFETFYFKHFFVESMVWKIINPPEPFMPLPLPNFHIKRDERI